MRRDNRGSFHDLFFFYSAKGAVNTLLFSFFFLQISWKNVVDYHAPLPPSENLKDYSDPPSPIEKKGWQSSPLPSLSGKSAEERRSPLFLSRPVFFAACVRGDFLVPGDGVFGPLFPLH